jgi:hypothetical protein
MAERRACLSGSNRRGTLQIAKLHRRYAAHASAGGVTRYDEKYAPYATVSVITVRSIHLPCAAPLSVFTIGRALKQPSTGKIGPNEPDRGSPFERHCLVARVRCPAARLRLGTLLSS